MWDRGAGAAAHPPYSDAGRQVPLDRLLKVSNVVHPAESITKVVVTAVSLVLLSVRSVRSANEDGCSCYRTMLYAR